jgi:dUTP pyrophosphatase
MIEVAVRRLRSDAVLPRQAYDGDAGVDLSACEVSVLEPGERAVIPTGLAVEIPDGYAGLLSRSGLAAATGSAS